MNIMKCIVLALLPVVFLSCAAGGSSVKLGKPYECSSKLNKAVKKYNERKYGDVQVSLEDVKIQCSGSDLMDSVVYYLAKSYFKTKNYTEARSNFERLSRDFPGSQFQDEARFRIAHAVFLSSNPPDRDQAETKEAVRLFKDFLDSYKDSPFADSAAILLTDAINKLAQKEFGNARFYQKLGELDAAIVYYNTVIKEYPESKYADLSKITVAELYADLDRYEESLEMIDVILETVKDKEILKRAEVLRARVKNAS